MNKKRMLTSEEVAYFCYQAAIILDSGVPLYDGLAVLTAETREKSTPEANELMDAITASLSSDKPLYTAMDETGMFPVYCIKTVMAGELSGRLDEALKGLADYYERSAAFSESVRSAVISPLIMLVISSAVIAVLTIKILPMFAVIFEDFDPDIYSAVASSVKISASVGTAMLIICGVIFLAAALGWGMWKSEKGSAALMKIVSKLPFTRRASETAALAKFAGAVSMMISSGLTAAQALESTRGISSNPKVNKKIDECARLVMNDMPFSDAVEKTGLLPVFYARMLHVSYRSGSFDTAWSKISKKLSEESDLCMSNIVSSVEPALTALLTVAAGVIILTVMIPLMNIMSSIA